MLGLLQRQDTIDPNTYLKHLINFNDLMTSYISFNSTESIRAKFCLFYGLHN